MYSDDFEKAFGDFLESEVYDRGEDALFTLTRAAFIAGWKAAGGEPPEPHRLPLKWVFIHAPHK